ncbi:hypothetical protein RND71_005630 [Anisodus tanguticus]|uniref:Uncharacterized protein n=1 Tax=Anisodus tanguticus TaxID=243964 RepID=A0AAE1SPD3_9SOLA|nr:hypothetical protein RND71_005630 [Anisodus tanguticus]
MEIGRKLSENESKHTRSRRMRSKYEIFSWTAGRNNVPTKQNVLCFALTCLPILGKAINAPALIAPVERSMSPQGHRRGETYYVNIQEHVYNRLVCKS